MKQAISIKLLGAALLLALSPVNSAHAFFPTFDTTEIVNTISTYTTQVQNVSSSVQSALSVDKIKQAMGDAVGSISKFTDLKEKKEKLQKKLEKQRRRLERLAELRQKWEDAKSQIQDVADAVEDAYDETKDAVEDAYDAGKDLYDEGKDMYDDAADLYKLQVSDLSCLERMGEKSASKIIEGIEASKQVPFERVLFAMGIRYVGETIAKKLCHALKNIDAIANAGKEQLVAIDEIGESIADSVIAFFADDVNADFVNRLRESGLQFSVPESANVGGSDKLKGLSIVISGVFQRHSRDELKQLIELHGGKNTGSISAKTSYVLAGDNMGPAKLEKAKTLGVPIISEEDFERLIG